MITNTFNELLLNKSPKSATDGRFQQEGIKSISDSMSYGYTFSDGDRRQLPPSANVITTERVYDGIRQLTCKLLLKARSCPAIPVGRLEKARSLLHA